MLPVKSDMAYLLIYLEVRQRRVDEPIAIKTPFGWTLFGNATKGLCETINANLLGTIERLLLQQQIERFWEVDSYATKQDPSEATLSVEDKRALAVLQSSTVKERGHYKTPLLWKGEPIMANNRAMAVSRLHSAQRKLKKDPELAEKYKKVINDYVNRGHAKKMTYEEAKSTLRSTCHTMQCSTPTKEMGMPLYMFDHPRGSLRASRRLKH